MIMFPVWILPASELEMLGWCRRECGGLYWVHHNCLRGLPLGGEHCRALQPHQASQQDNRGAASQQDNAATAAWISNPVNQTADNVKSFPSALNQNTYFSCPLPPSSPNILRKLLRQTPDATFLPNIYSSEALHYFHSLVLANDPSSIRESYSYWNCILPIALHWSLSGLWRDGPENAL